MGRNPNSSNTSEVPAFTTIKAHEKRAVILKAEGKTMEAVTAHINNEFALDYSVVTVKEWFFAGGRLEQAYSEYLEASAVIALKEARQLIKRATKGAVAVLVEQLGITKEETIRQGAAKSLLNKYIPDRQVTLDSIGAEEDIPPELAEIADGLKDEEVTDGSQPVDDASVGGQDHAETGA